MKTNVYLGIAIRIIVLCLFAMAITFITPELRTFFGDVYVPNGISDEGIDKYWDWGARHYWYFWTMIFLFLLSLINVIMQIVKIIEKNYGNIKF